MTSLLFSLAAVYAVTAAALVSGILLDPAVARRLAAEAGVPHRTEMIAYVTGALWPVLGLAYLAGLVWYSLPFLGRGREWTVR